MCLTIDKIKFIKYGKYNIVGFKTFGISRTRGLTPLIYSENDYLVSIDSNGDYIISAKLYYPHEILLKTKTFDLELGIDEYWEIFGNLYLGIHSFLNTESSINFDLAKPLEKYITLIVLIDAKDIQIISGNEIVSKSIIVPKLETFKNIVSLLNNYNFLLQNEFDIDFKRLEEYFSERFFNHLNKIYEILNQQASYQ